MSSADVSINVALSVEIARDNNGRGIHVAQINNNPPFYCLIISQSPRLVCVSIPDSYVPIIETREGRNVSVQRTLPPFYLTSVPEDCNDGVLVMTFSGDNTVELANKCLCFDVAE
jgi:hypothetical protein